MGSDRARGESDALRIPENLLSEPLHIEVVWQVHGGRRLKPQKKKAGWKYSMISTGKLYGACRKSEHQGHFSCGRYIEHRCICMPATLTPEELGQKEKAFLEENPGWLHDDS